MHTMLSEDVRGHIRSFRHAFIYLTIQERLIEYNAKR
jgi:hypothetical protein